MGDSDCAINQATWGEVGGDLVDTESTEEDQPNRQYVLDPNVRAIAEHAIAERLQAVFKGTTNIDLDELAAAVVIELVDPIAQRNYESRDAMFMHALEASIDYAVLRQHGLQDEINRLTEENERMAAKIIDLRAEVRMAKAAKHDA